ncbi:hypothetical protein DSO57_1001097 [Entomophthora muscae]|uniref:Uncharacterized protein n=1 Tax=Entomophthora muscae TaxID=34485 RepID=A0ACC2SB58_9FUNG|nr:hypothetical protein DSO57_1001097 [Entomophthora muscae]
MKSFVTVVANISPKNCSKLLCKSYQRVLIVRSQIILGLEFMHSSGFFHRDLKPENILVTQNCVKIADFGQVHELKTKGKKLTPYVSTRWYRAPEVLLGYRFYGPAIDLWAVGAIAAELMTLRPLFPGATSSDQLNKICSSLGSPGQFSHGGPWPLGSQLANLAGMNFPQQVSGSLMKTLITYPHLDPSCSRSVKALLQFDPTRRITAKHALHHEFFSGDTQSSSPLSSYSGSLSATSEELGLPSIAVDSGVPSSNPHDLSQSGSELEISLLRDRSCSPSPLSDHFNFCPSAQNKSPTHNIPMQAIHSLPFPELKTHSRKQQWGAVSIENPPELNRHRFSLYDVLDSPEIRSLTISRSNTEPIELKDVLPQFSKSTQTPNVNMSLSNLQTDPQLLGGLRRKSKIPQGEFTSLRRLSVDYEKLLACDQLYVKKDPYSQTYPPNRSSLEEELMGLMDSSFNSDALDGGVHQLPGSLGGPVHSHHSRKTSHSIVSTQMRRSLDLQTLSEDQYDLASFLSQPAPTPGLCQNSSQLGSTQVSNDKHTRARGTSISNLFGKVRHLFGRGGRPVAPHPCIHVSESNPNILIPERCWDAHV